MSLRILKQRPPDFRINPQHGLFRGLVFRGLGWMPGSSIMRDGDGSPGYVKNHGTLTNMDPATDWVWVPQLGRWGIDAASSNQYVTATIPWLQSQCGFGMWIYPRNVTSSVYASAGQSVDSNNARCIILGYQSGYFNIYNQGYPTGSAADTQIAATINIWQHIYYSTDGSRVYGWKNGILVIDVAANLNRGANTWYNIGTNAGGTEGANCQFADFLYFDRCPARHEIAALADPSNAMLGGLILPPRRRVFKAAAAAATGSLLLRLQTEGLYVGSRT